MRYLIFILLFTPVILSAQLSLVAPVNPDTTYLPILVGGYKKYVTLGDLLSNAGGGQSQTLSLAGTDLSISSGNTVDLSSLQDGVGISTASDHVTIDMNQSGSSLGPRVYGMIRQGSTGLDLNSALSGAHLYMIYGNTYGGTGTSLKYGFTVTSAGSGSYQMQFLTRQSNVDDLFFRRNRGGIWSDEMLIYHRNSPPDRLEYSSSFGNDFNVDVGDFIHPLYGSTNGPGTGAIGMFFDDPNRTDQTGWQIAATTNGTLRSRGVFAGVFTDWFAYWNNINDGDGSGLDADLLDGREGDYFAPVGSALSVDDDNDNDTYIDVPGSDSTLAAGKWRLTFNPFYDSESADDIVFEVDFAITDGVGYWYVANEVANATSLITSEITIQTNGNVQASLLTGVFEITTGQVVKLRYRKSAVASGLQTDLLEETSLKWEKLN